MCIHLRINEFKYPWKYVIEKMTQVFAHKDYDVTDIYQLYGLELVSCLLYELRPILVYSMLVNVFFV